MIRGEIVGDTVLVESLRNVSRSSDTNVRNSIARLTLRLQRKVQAEKLTGQVLKVRTGTLRRSIGQMVTLEADAVVGIVSTNVKYARLHEYGFSGTETVRAHLRMVKQSFGKQLKAAKAVQVKSFTRRVTYPERSFLRSALREMQGAVEADLSATVNESLS